MNRNWSLAHVKCLCSNAEGAAKVTVSGFYDLWASGLAQLCPGLSENSSVSMGSGDHRTRICLVEHRLASTETAIRWQWMMDL